VKILSHWRNLVCWPVIAALPLSLAADNTGAAVLRSSGVVLVNKNPVPSTSTLLAGDVIETQKSAMARIELAGSAVDINPETVIHFNAEQLVLDHGSLSVNTSLSLKLHVGCVTVAPVNIEWTHYDVADLDGRITVSAIKNDVYVESGSINPQPVKQSARSDRDIVREGEQASREERCGGPAREQSAPVAGTGGIMNSPYAQGIAGGVIVAVGCWALCRGDDPISPDRP
jgi:hypothetical protein